MINISKKTLQDLEFESVIIQVASHNVTSLGKTAILETIPFSKRTNVVEALQLTNEFVASFENENRIPNHGFDAITKELKLIKIENNYLEIDGFRKILSICITTNVLLKFFKKFHEYYPLLHGHSSQIETNTSISDAINSVVDKYGEIRNNASDLLYTLRKSIQSVRTKVNTSFNSALSMYNSADYLDDIRETVMENRRVLAVKAMYRRKVKGSIMGASKTGSIVYIEPDTTQQHQRDLNNLEFEETEEVKRILLELTSFISGFSPLLESYQLFLTKLDIVYAKAKYAKSINAISPEITEDQEIDLVNAYHPLLLVANKNEGITTFPQTISMTTESRIIVISGPNAGGKSITLKTVGLLQLMVQSGMLIPVHERSKLCLFESILSDIGDNQSIENQLSTYSYRLSRMKFFLDKLDHNSLVLLDEFGSGSDPELGGALAEVFYEEMYDRKCFAVINTHYTNIKILTSKKEEAINAFMLFDTKELKPLFKLSVGQPGSSFTFEVARINGIQDDLIKRAQGKVSEHKVNLDQLAIDLQREKSEFNKANKLQNIATKETNELTKKYEEKLQDLYEKTNQQHRFFEQKSKFLKAGKKLFDLIRKHKGDETNKELNEAMKKYIAVEKKRALETTDAVVLDKTIKEVLVEKPSAPKPRRTKGPTIPQKKKAKVGSRVKIPGYNRTGKVQSIKGNSAEVLIGNFKVKAKLVDLEVFT